ncbi:hypothetical protein EVAR_43041_1 [Eumeta japonica]|uniref:Uncharacterized protein n=1 Tax=Eumeta variegata TaxID=151549 RepID=A0A4C1XP94_EUMVA|nr:hypothetical protein EVAR_43041_1 [Eumeta japonica]
MRLSANIRNLRFRTTLPKIPVIEAAVLEKITERERGVSYDTFLGDDPKTSSKGCKQAPAVNRRSDGSRSATDCGRPSRSSGGRTALEV